MNPSPSAQNPISQPLKKANPSSHFTPSRPSVCKEGYNGKFRIVFHLSTLVWIKMTIIFADMI